VLAGLTLGHGRGHVARAIVEASALAIRHVAVPMLAAGVRVTEMRVCGGPARSTFWNQVKADVTGFHVAVPAVLETAVLGSAILATVGVGLHATLPAAISAMTRIESRLEPRSELTPVYDRLFEAYLALYPATAPILRPLGSGVADCRRPFRARRRRAGRRLRGIDFAFQTRRGAALPVLDRVELDIPAGAIIALIGPNGCGKSTLLRVVAGLLAPVAGEAQLDGVPIAGPDPRIGLAFQEPRLLPWRSAADNITFRSSSPAGRTGNGRLASLTGLVGLDPRWSHRGVSYPRHAPAVAGPHSRSARVLLLDEPFSALDALTRERFDLELLRLWERAATTIVMVTHSIPEAILVADRVVVLSPRPGRVVADIAVDLPRPRTIADLDQATVSSTSREIRAHLGDSDALGESASSAGVGVAEARVREEFAS
jgi:NitT/TauT family transport system ATP-binding protein